MEAAAVDGEKNPPEKDKDSPEEEKKAGEGGGTHGNLDGNKQTKNPPEEEEKIPVEEMHAAPLETKLDPVATQVTSYASMLDGKDLQQFGGSKKMQLGGSEKTQLGCSEEPTSEGGTAVINKGHVDERNELQKIKKRKRNELQKIKKENELCEAETQVLVDVLDPASEPSFPWMWYASYYTKIHQRQKPLYKGSILVDPKVNRVTLLDDEEITIDARKLKEGELIFPGLVLEFPCHIVKIGKQILEAKEDLTLPTISDEGDGESLGGDDKHGVDNEKQPPSKRKRSNKERKDEKKRNKLKRKRSDEKMPLRSPQANLVGSSIGMFARVASLRKRMSPQLQRRKSESPSIPNVTAHFTSPNLPRVEADFTRRRPRKLKSRIWKDFNPIYEHGKVAEGQCKHCNEVFPSSKNSGTNHIHRHLRKCVKRSNMLDMVEKMRSSTSSPQVSALDSWRFSQEESRRNLANMIVHHGLPFSIVEYSGFRKFVKSLNPMFKMVSRTTIREDCMDSYREQRSMLRETLKNCGVRVSLTADMWTSNQRLGYCGVPAACPPASIMEARILTWLV